LADRRLWHTVGLVTHALLGSANLVFWPSFVELNLVPVGVVTTVLHLGFVAAHRACLGAAKPAGASSP